MITDVPAGTLYVQEAGGGGGFGPPEERPADRVLEEVRDGLISPEAAAEHYGVVIDRETMQFQEEETARLRASMTQER